MEHEKNGSEFWDDKTVPSSPSSLEILPGTKMTHISAHSAPSASPSAPAWNFVSRWTLCGAPALDEGKATEKFRGWANRRAQDGAAPLLSQVIILPSWLFTHKHTHMCVCPPLAHVRSISAPSSSRSRSLSTHNTTNSAPPPPPPPSSNTQPRS